MPTILRIESYRFYFYSNERGEPAHIHVQSDRMLAKFWLNPVFLAGSTRFPPRDLRRIERLVIEKSDVLLEAWNEHFSG